MQFLQVIQLRTFRIITIMFHFLIFYALSWQIWSFALALYISRVHFHLMQIVIIFADCKSAFLHLLKYVFYRELVA